MPVSAMAMCVNFYWDKDGQVHSVICGSNMPELSCDDATYWDGETCKAVEIIQTCEEQAGEWDQVEIISPESNQNSIFNTCICPDKKVWDGKTCRSDIPRSKQCAVFVGEEVVRVTISVLGSKECVPVPKK